MESSKVANHDLTKIDANPEEEETELQIHLEASFQINIREVKKKKNRLLPRKLEDQQKVRFWFPPHAILLLITTVFLFFIAYRNGGGYVLPVMSLGMLNSLLFEHYVPIYLSMPLEIPKSSDEIRMRFIVWSLYTFLLFIAVFLSSDIWSWKFGTTVAVDVVVFVVSVFLLITGNFEYYLLRRGRD